MLFSVLIPVYNTSAYLIECIESVLKQTEKDFEIVLIDDGSTDISGRICDEYVEKYSNIRVIHKDNEGLLLTRRRGFIEARGEYFVCLDSDDCLADEDALKKLKDIIENDKCDLILYEYIYGEVQQGNIRRIELFDLPNEYVFQEDEKEVLYQNLLVGKWLNPLCIKCVSREIVDIDVNYLEASKTLYRSQGEDLLQSFPILTNAKRIGYLKEPLYFYRWNEKSISRNVRLEFYYAYKTIYQTADKYIDLWNIEKDIIEQHKLKRISMIMGVVVNGLKESNKVKSFNFIDMLSKDLFFKELFNVNDKGKILLYYRILGFLMLHNCPRSTLWMIWIVSSISNWKRGKRK